MQLAYISHIKRLRGLGYRKAYLVSRGGRPDSAIASPRGMLCTPAYQVRRRMGAFGQFLCTGRGPLRSAGGSRKQSHGS